MGLGVVFEGDGGDGDGGVGFMQVTRCDLVMGMVFFI